MTKGMICVLATTMFANNALATTNNAVMAISHAIENTDRPTEDLTLDSDRKPAQVLNFFQVAPKSQVLEVFAGGGYATGGMYKFGSNGNMGSPNDAPNVANENAYFSFSFDTVGMMADISSMVYGDCTAEGLMMMGQVCMTGSSLGGTMGATPLALSISEVSAVPVPAAAWLFGGALMSLFGANRRKNVLPA